MCEFVVKSEIFTLKFEIVKFQGKKLKRDFSVKSAWKTRDFTVKVRDKPVILESPTDFKNRNSSIVNLLNIQWLIVNTIIDQGDHGHAKKARERALRAKTEVNGSDESGPKVTYDILSLSLF